MKCLASIVLLGLLASAHAAYLQVGQEYVYSYYSSVTAGSEDYVNFASSFNLTGKVRIQKTSPTLLKVKLDDVKFGAYNGEFSYFPLPTYDTKAYQELNPLTEPFHVQLDSNNLVTGIVLSQTVPEWARNIQRGLAGTLQVHEKKGEGSNYQTAEKTVNGDCPVVNQIVVDAEKKEFQLRKYTSHQDCENRALQTRRPGFTVQHCPDENSRDVYNSSYWAVYDVANRDGVPTITKVQSGGSVHYQLMGSRGHQQYSFVWTTFELDEVKSGGFSKIGDPASAKNYNGLKYVFEYEPSDDEEPSEAHPFFFHYKDAIKDDASLNKVIDVIIDGIKKLAGSLSSPKVFSDLIQFHKASPFQILPVLSALDYNQLQVLYNKVKAEAGDKKTIELQILYDSLVASGSSPAALLIRDIVKETKDITVVSRLVAKLPAYLRNPNEKLLKELEVLIRPDSGKQEGRMIAFSFASLVSRVCEKHKCSKSGLLDKYIKIFSDQFDNAQHFEDKTVAVTALRNIRLGGALDKLYAIAVNKDEDRTVRVQAIVGLKYLIKTDPEKVKEALLPIFYDKQAHPELRNTAAIIYLMYTFDEKNVQQMVFSMWSEPCKYVKNFLYTFLKGAAYSTRPCVAKRAHVAKTVLAFFPPWTIDRTLSGNYIKDYYDPEFNFGQLSHYSIQRTGSSLLPLSLYASLNGAFAGYATSYLTAFIRLEGLGDALASRIMSMRTGQIDFSEVKEIFGKIGVKERETTPLRIEIGVYLHNRAVFYHAADAKSITTIPQIIKKLQELKKSFEYDASRLLLLGGLTVEQPSALGTPISTITSGAAFIGFNVKIEREQGPTSITSKQDMKLHSHLFGYSSVNNHLPAFGSMHSVVAVRTLRVRLPRQVTMGFDWKQLAFNFDISTPTEDNPFIAMTHATSFTNVKSDQGPHKDQTIHALLKGSCPNCEVFAQVSKGKEHRKGRRIGIAPIEKFMSGIKRGAEYFDCEKPHSRYHTIKKLAKFFGEQNKNYETFRLGRLILGVEYMWASIFLQPTTQTCGLKAYFYQDKDAKTIWEKVEGQVKVKYTSDAEKKLGTKIMLKGNLNFNYIGPEPNTRTVDVVGNFQFTGFEKRQSKLRFSGKDQATGKTGVLCVEINAQNKKAEDWFAYDGPNEPEFERNMKFHWGPEPAGGKEGACPTTAAYIKIQRKAHRSQEQKEEVTAGVWPYKQCAAQKGSPEWPGSKTPATYECIQSAYEQTNLRESNITIEYKLDAEARNRWKKPLALLSAFMVPYWEEEAKSDHVHTAQGPGEPGFVEGKLEIDVSSRKESPTLDVHWHGSGGREEHFHNIDLDVLPGPLKIKPVASRFSEFYYNAIRAGIFASCVNSPKSVVTFDNVTYQTDLTECPTLLAGDCDDKPRFAVLSKKIAADKVGIIVNVGDHKIEFKDLNTAVVDDKEVPITDSVYVDEDEEQMYKFVKINPTFVLFTADKLGVIVGYTGNYASVTVGSRYRSSACGLCGNFDGSTKNDFTGPDNVCKVLPAKMAEAYTVRDGSCAGKGSPCP